MDPAGDQRDPERSAGESMNSPGGSKPQGVEFETAHQKARQILLAGLRASGSGSRASRRVGICRARAALALIWMSACPAHPLRRLRRRSAAVDALPDRD